MAIYAREGVAYLWIVDPLLQTVESYYLEAKRWVVLPTACGGAGACIEPFEVLELPLARWWIDL